MSSFFSFIFFILVIFLGRFDSSLLSYQILNPDESQMMANAIRLHSNNFLLHEFDGTSSGILNSLILTWPVILNLDITFLSTRFTAVILLSAIVYLTMRIISLDLDKKNSFLFILPILLFFSFTKDADFLHYSSELLSTIFLLAGFLNFKKFIKSKKKLNLILSMFFLGSILFAKIQIFPAAAIFAFLILIYLIFIKKLEYKIIFFSIISFLVPIILFLTIFYINNTLSDYFINYFEFSQSVVTQSQKENLLIEVVKNENQEFAKSEAVSNFYNHILYNTLFHLFYAYIILTIYFLILNIKKRNFTSYINVEFIFLSIIILISFFSIIITGLTHRHYFIPLIPLASIFTAKVFYINLNYDFKNFTKKIAFFPIILALIISLVFEKNKFYGKRINYVHFQNDSINAESPRIFQYLIDQKNKMYIWGWAPEWYVLGYLQPATRETISQKQIDNYSSRKYYRSRLLKDFLNSKPELVVDYVKSKSFRYNQNKDSLLNSSPLKKVITSKYKKLNQSDEDCPSYFLQKDVYEKLFNRLINYSTIDKIKKINDFSVTEDICNDSVLFAKEDKDKILLKFDNEEKVKKILILGSKKNKNKSLLEISILNNNKEVYKEKISLNLYPFWTRILLKKEKIVGDEISININSLKENNNGINEIKIYEY